MCGIVGYIGSEEAQPILLEGLDRLSYRGYDSSGMAVISSTGELQIRKVKGRLENLKEQLQGKPLKGHVGIGHTRWATHGEPNDVNAHPHTDATGVIAVVHNGIIENFEELRCWLREKGIQFVSQTDTEVIAHLLHYLHKDSMKDTIQQAMRMLKGSYALGIVCAFEPEKLYCARNDSPLVLGFRDGEGWIASDIPALLSHTRDVIFLKDQEVGVLTRQGISVYDACGQNCPQSFFHVDWDLVSAEKGGYAHYMLKEIHEQPSALQRTFAPRGRMGDYGWFPLGEQEARKLKKIVIVACGTAFHAAVLGKYAIEKLACVPVEAEVASEYRYRDAIIDGSELFIAISQSGETADTLAALRQAKRNGVRVMAICNALGSSIAREAGESNTLYTHAGPEIAVASTKAYITQAEMMILLATVLGHLRGVQKESAVERMFRDFSRLPQKAQETLKIENLVHRLTKELCHKEHVFFVGRGLDYALSLEAALKLKEVSYVFSEAYAAGELKHGPIALLQEGSAVVACVTQAALLEKTLSNLQEAAARGAHVLAVCPASLSERVKAQADNTVVIPDAGEWLTPLLAIIPMQLLAYYMAVSRGCDVDKPRNLAKSVTVE